MAEQNQRGKLKLKTHLADRALPDKCLFQDAESLPLFRRAQGLKLFYDCFYQRNAERARVRYDLRIVMKLYATLRVPVKILYVFVRQAIDILVHGDDAARDCVMKSGLRGVAPAQKKYAYQ